MKSKLKQEWNNKLHMALGYMIVEDDDGLRALNSCIKGIIQSERHKWKCDNCNTNHEEKED